jgi:peptidase E
VPARERHILATSGGFRPTDRYGWEIGPLIDHALELSGASRPRICYLATAGGDNLGAYALFYAAFAGREDVRASHLQLFTMPNIADPARHLLEQDVIWVGGGSVAGLLAMWQLHGIDDAMRAAWESGVVLAGVSAGSLCWHVGGTTDSFGPDLRPVTNGLALVPYGNGVHYDSEEQRRPLLHSLVADGTLPLSYATDDGVGLHYVGTELYEVVSDRDEVFGYRVERAADGMVTETVLEPRRLG